MLTTAIKQVAGTENPCQKWGALLSCITAPQRRATTAGSPY